mmetsp:Transcript_4210/g.3956  ORF Transcript_4210/g.3956 Transcript_4210/m.3956 type:complete len:95 (-) Transcript_4210:480-764(-)
MQREINTLIDKLEMMCVKLGGPKDPDNPDDPLGIKTGNEFDYLRQIVQENFKLIAEELAERHEKIQIHGYNSNERILADEEIKTYIEDTQDQLK